MSRNDIRNYCMGSMEVKPISEIMLGLLWQEYIIISKRLLPADVVPLTMMKIRARIIKKQKRGIDKCKFTV